MSTPAGLARRSVLNNISTLFYFETSATLFRQPTKGLFGGSSSLPLSRSPFGHIQAFIVIVIA
jgi:hypothetical protein